MSCPICSSGMRKCFKAKVLMKYEVQYEVCDSCGYLRAHDPDWLEEAYNSAIANADTGLVQRNISIASKLTTLFYFGFDSKGSYLDIAGGYGMLTRLMRDYGFDFYWSDKYCHNLLARGFESDKANEKFVALTAFEVLEHVHDPLEFITQVMEKHGSRTLIFTTELFQNSPPSKDWWYYVFNTGQHISFYQPKTFKLVAKQLGLEFYSANGIHMLTDKIMNKAKYSLLTNRFFVFVMTFYVRRRMRSLTFDDHCNIMNGEVNDSKGNG